MTEALAGRDLSLGELADWAEGQAKRLAANFGLDMARDQAMFALAQTAKLGEEVGELQAEILGALNYCRSDKADQFTPRTLAGELADVLVCTLLLGAIMKADVVKAAADKLDFLQQRSL